MLDAVWNFLKTFSSVKILAKNCRNQKLMNLPICSTNVVKISQISPHAMFDFQFFFGVGGGNKNWVKILTKNCRNWIFDESLNLFGKIYWKFPRLVHMLCLMLCECFTIFWKKIAQIIDQKLQKLIFWWISQSIQPNRVKISHISPHGMLDDLWNFQILPFLVPADMALPRVYNKTIFNIGNKASIT